MTDSVSGATIYVYDDNNRLTSLTNPSSLTVSFQYDALNRPTLRTYPNGVTTEYEYNARGDLTRLANMNGANVISSFNYTYDDGGKRTFLDQVRSATVNSQLDFQYDNLDRLIDATNQLPSNPDETFIYDPVGNRLSQTGQTTNSIFNANNQLLEDENFLYEYDLNGNLIEKEDKNTSEITTFTYDGENKLIQVNKGGVITDYDYDGLGRRVRKIEDGVVTRYIYENTDIGSDILLKYNSGTSLRNKYTNGPGIDNKLIMQPVSGGTYYFLGDGLNSVTEMVDSGGSIVNSYVYDSFGTIVDKNETITNPITYTSRELDLNGLYYYRERYYDSSIGRFLSEDPIGFDGGINFYVYVGNSPINYFDPFGLQNRHRIKDFCGPLGTAIGGLFGGFFGARIGGFAGFALCTPLDCALDPLNKDCPMGDPCNFFDGNICPPEPCKK